MSSNILCLQIDKAVLQVMSDDQMAKYVTSYGDRIAVLSFCKQTETAQCSTEKETVLQRLRDKIGTRKMKAKTKGVCQKTGEGMSRQRNTAGEKSSRKIEIGWLHFGSNDYQQVRTRNGGGTRHMSLDKTTTVAQILDIGKDLFFPNGHSPKGQAADFTFHVCDFKRNKIPLDDTVGRLYEQTMLKLLRFYICTKVEGPSTDEDSLSEDLSEGADLQLADGCHTDSEDLITDQLDDNDSDKSYEVCGSMKYICNQ